MLIVLNDLPEGMFVLFCFLLFKFEMHCYSYGESEDG